MIAPPTERAFADCLAALDEPGFAHLTGIALSVGGDVRSGGRAVDRPTDAFSITKAVLARGVLLAIGQGYFTGLDDPLTLAGRTGVPVRPGDLLWMTQPWAREPDMDRLEQGPDDPLPAILDALGDGTGAGGGYVNAGSHLMMRELDQRTGSAREFLASAVLAPAGLDGVVWETDQAGVPWGHAHLRLSVRALLDLGRHWLAEPLAARLRPPTAPMPPENLPYAAGWWCGDGYRLAAGWGGQLLLLVPGRDTVVAALGETGWDRASNSDTLAAGWRSGRELFEARLAPAVLGRTRA